MHWLAEAGFRWWQILPLNPTGYGNSPYQPLSSFAGNPLLLSPAELHRQELLTGKELALAESVPGPAVPWRDLLPARHALAARAAGRALARNPAGFDDFCRSNAPWLKPWSRYAALKDANRGKPWREWKSRRARPGSEEIHAMIQYLFQEQWDRILGVCGRAGVKVMGDLPIYTSFDSADVWSRRELFLLDEAGDPTAVAGVPPDYFSPTGQLWGNPLYDWKAHAGQDWEWWSLRLARALDLCHALRIDHFRGFCDYWEIPAGEVTAVRGVWREGPGKGFFRGVERRLGKMPPIVAEDLGIITPEVTGLREELGFPGMLVLQFALDDPGFDPASVPENTVIYTGTHDNDTTLGWLRKSGLNLTLKAVVDMALDSPAKLSIIPVQDILGLGGRARMNTPGTATGNWGFRLGPGSLPSSAARTWKDRLASRGRA